MSEAKDAGRGTIGRYALLGAAVGVAFPFAATLLAVGARGESLSLGALVEAQVTQPLLWIIDVAPVVLALLAVRLGRKQLEIVALKREADALRSELGGHEPPAEEEQKAPGERREGGSALPDGEEPSPRRARQPWCVRLLLAEDNKVNQMLAVAVLRKRGYDVTVADNGRQAVELVTEGDFDLVLMDVQMPEMDGLEATSAIRDWEVDTGRRLPIIAVTAHAMERDRQLLLDAGMDDYVSKPIDPETLEAVVRRWTGELPVFEPGRALDLAEGDEDVLGSIVELFLEQTPERMAAIRRALDAADATGVERTALTLEGAAVRLAMPHLRDVARRIAVLSNRGELERAAVLMDELDEAVGTSTTAVRDTLEEDFA